MRKWEGWEKWEKWEKWEFQLLSPPSHRLPQAAIDVPQCVELVDQLIDEDSAIVSLYFGSDSTEENAQELASLIQEKYPDVEVEINDGGQPIYYYVISVE